jgi:molybdopterin-containing oxidoreductase family iron-sulfur binding subunit
VDNDKFDYNFNGEFSKMVLNPDVVVRERGVVEKCSFCVQRIQEGKLEAKKENRMLRDGDVQPACVQGCPSKALVFGDMNNKDSKVAQNRENPRMYNLLEELHTLASVGYLTKVRNKEAGHEDQDEHHS